MTLEEIGRMARAAMPAVSGLGTDQKNAVLRDAADQLLAANGEDLRAARESGMPDGLYDRLKLTAERIHGMADGLRAVAQLEDPIGSVRDMRRRPNGLEIGRMTVPIGVIGVIYEARPNVTSDVFALCFKTGNVSILKGGATRFTRTSPSSAC